MKKIITLILVLLIAVPVVFAGDSFREKVYEKDLKEGNSISKLSTLRIRERVLRNVMRERRMNQVEVSSLGTSSSVDSNERQNEEGEIGWPVDYSRPQSLLSSGFGPRLKASDNYRYDFHRGIDIPGSTGDDVLSIADGEVYRVYEEGSSVYPNGGNVIVVKHSLDEEMEFHGEEITRYYSLYMHLDGFEVSEGDSVEKGEVVGYIGSSGDTDFEHLHFEIRMGTTCSLEFQQDNLGVCGYEGFDPHVNPLLLLPFRQRDRAIVEVDERADSVKVSIRSPRHELDVNRIKLNGKVVDFNTREGIDTSNIDNQYYQGILIEAEQFNSETRDYELEVIFYGEHSVGELIVEDVFGNRLF